MYKKFFKTLDNGSFLLYLCSQNKIRIDMEYTDPIREAHRYVANFRRCTGHHQPLCQDAPGDGVRVSQPPSLNSQVTIHKSL